MNQFTYKTFLSHHISQIKKEGGVAINRKLRKLPVAIMWLPIIIILSPIVLIIRLIKPIIWIRFGYFWAERIGHFVFDVEYFLTEKKLDINPQRTFDLFFYDGKPANKFFGKLAKRYMKITSWCKPLYITNRLIPGGSKHTLLPAIRRMDSRDKKLLFKRIKPQVSFNHEENISGLEYLKMIGLKRKDKFVCLIARDSAYLSKNHGKLDYSYHNYRDTNIEDYKDTVLYLADKGYWVFRMGKTVHKTFDISHSKVVDYANSENRSDFLDIWLMANCFFCISNGTGLDEVSRIFRKPAVYVDYLPFNVLVTYDQCITVPKHLIWKDTNKPLNLSEHLIYDYGRSETYDKAGILIRDLSPKEKKQAVLEMEKRLNGTWRSTNLDENLNNRFRGLLKSHKTFHKYHGEIHPESRVGAHFLRNNSEWLN